MIINQNGEEVFTKDITHSRDFRDEDELAEALLLVIEHLGLDLVRTNDTKHGETELQLKPKA